MTGRVHNWKKRIEPHHPSYVAMREAIRNALIEQDNNPNRLATELGLNRFFIYDYLACDKNELEATKTARILAKLGLPLELLLE